MLKRIALAAMLTAAAFAAGAQMSGAAPAPHGYPATLRCPAGLAEDSAGNVRLVEFARNADGTVTIVYRCKRFGY